MAEQLRPDIAAAAARLSTAMGSRREIRKLVEHLWQGERVEALASGFYGNGNGLVALTDRRLFFLRDGWTGASTEDFPLSRLSSVSWNSGVLMGTITVFASGNKAEIKQVPKADGKALTDRVRAVVSGQVATPPPGPYSASPHGAPPVAPPVAPPAGVSYVKPAPAQPSALPAAGGFPAVMEQLRQLAELRDAGVISAADFEGKKVELLARI